jgi:MFS family permease
MAVDDAESVITCIPREETAATEDTPLLKPPEEPSEESWKPPRGFLWIEIAIFANVFLYGFDSTITAATYAVISSDLDAANTASWLTTSFLVTSTAFQPLYGRFSDIFGRRPCFFASTITFGLGCLGCGLAQDVVTINLMRALTGFGGGGLMTMPTIINSDMIPFRRRGMYQALQNTVFGMGAICDASFGGAIADGIGWRYCFILQVPISVIALVLGWLVVKNQHVADAQAEGSLGHQVWAKVDFVGSIVLVIALSVQLVGLSVGGNELPWSNGWVVGALVGSGLLLAPFFVIEARTTAIPIIPLRMFRRKLSLTIQLTNLCAGISSYAVSSTTVEY